MSKVRVYFEGDATLRPGFQHFFTSLTGDDRSRLRFVAGEATVVRDFMIALRKHPDSLNLLLLDCEGSAESCSLASLERRADWRPLQGAQVRQAQVFWMVQIMESWFLADREALAAYYGNGFRATSLPGNPRVEEIPKADVLRGLREASRDTQKGQYHKTKHAPVLLKQIDPRKVQAAAPNCRRLFDELQTCLTD